MRGSCRHNTTINRYKKGVTGCLSSICERRCRAALVRRRGAQVLPTGLPQEREVTSLYFRSKKTGDLLLALLLSISATTCSAPQDDHPGFTPDPPNVEMASLGREVAIELCCRHTPVQLLDVGVGVRVRNPDRKRRRRLSGLSAREAVLICVRWS